MNNPPVIEKKKLGALIEISIRRSIKLNHSNGVSSNHMNTQTVARRNANFQLPSAKSLRKHLEKRRRKCLERDKKISRSLALLVVAFALCW